MVLHFYKIRRESLGTSRAQTGGLPCPETWDSEAKRPLARKRDGLERSPEVAFTAGKSQGSRWGLSRMSGKEEAAPGGKGKLDPCGLLSRTPASGMLRHDLQS